ncbi:MAG: DUF58 domain-containing protein [Gammaproteobacteria bacterium]|nr:DUF58 domain-containing protein [Gammaproteobacteria bacterium]
MSSVVFVKVLKKHWEPRWNNWLQKRFPDTRQITLDIQRIFVIPTMISAALVLTVLVLALMAINFQNSLIYGLSFWLLALIVMAIFFTYRNLSGLTIRAIQSSPCFAGEKAVFELEVSCPQKQKKTAITVGCKHEDVVTVNLQNHHSLHIKLSHSTRQRGRFKPGRLTIFSVYPIGLVVAWSYAALNMQSIVYPVPVLHRSGENGKGLDEKAEQGLEIINGSTDFAGIRDYRSGDSPKHIHWGAFAKTGDVYTKTFVDYASHDLWLEWDALTIPGVEARLSHLCAKVLQYYGEQQIYGLKIPGKTIQPTSGDAHKNNCLTALALYGDPGEI